ncbi:TetR/AcrR family transcriptional regulator [Mycolicibacterium sp. CH28]|uniref:TetR/AcrR family transcriptional regulator n=1 Tax=Mycolicibacterium sp. CH28 TaxID=2512237 RepID=UPI00108027D3|nr:TetR/AcrR family transcriptional regulator [Mycolicibacterium sp. CH28]TGD84416.1 TetR/AcrR family transcriptional regulator [Mycolicibacterium sp. CH28]
MTASPKTRRGQATVEVILDVACDLFTRRGIRATTLDDIGSAAGVGRGQIYHFFNGKSDIVAGVTTRQIRLVLDELEPVLGSMSTASDVRDLRTALVAYHSKVGAAVRCPMGVLIHQLSDADQAAWAALQSGFRQWEELLVQGLAQVAAHGELKRGADPRRLAAGFLAAYQGGLLLAELHGDLNCLELALDTVIAAALVPADREV